MLQKVLVAYTDDAFNVDVNNVLPYKLENTLVKMERELTKREEALPEVRTVLLEVSELTVSVLVVILLPNCVL